MPSLFLSHSGIDTDAASALKARILAAPDIQAQKLKVWFDKDDLRAGEPWQPQLEEAVKESSAFAVYVGSKGVVNWVDAEVRLALSRAFSEPEYRFIPIIAGSAAGPASLPGFVQQFQGVRNVEGNPDQFEKLLQALLDGDGELPMEPEPFFGLRAIDESRSHLFFGRDEESKSLTDRIQSGHFVIVTGDSGSGKSSLVRAGLVPAFRGGVLARPASEGPDDSIWHVVTTQPRNDPLRQLADAVDEAAKQLGVTLADRGTLADWAASGDLEQVRRALRCDLPGSKTRVLLVVDQFEELFTITPGELREPFVELLLKLADPDDDQIRVVLTMRNDYFNLCNSFERLKERLEINDRQARFLLGRMSDDGLRQIVTEPLRLARIEESRRDALAMEVSRDVGERPGDLALVQMALTETWQARSQHGDDLLVAYTNVGRVEGALALAAEQVRTQFLDQDERQNLENILVRLVRLGDTGGATRRVASQVEFSETQWGLLQKLAAENCKRLILIGGTTEHSTAEISHEALVTAWPYLQGLLQQAAGDKRVFDDLIERVGKWNEEPDKSKKDGWLATGADLESFSKLCRKREHWLSRLEADFVDESVQAFQSAENRQKWLFRTAVISALVFLIAAVAAGYFFLDARDKTTIAIEQQLEAQAQTLLAEQRQQIALENETRALAALSESASGQGDYRDAAKLAIAAWPRSNKDTRPKLQATINAMGNIRFLSRETTIPLRHEEWVNGAVFNRDETRILTWSDDNTSRVWDAATGKQIGIEMRHEGPVKGAVFNRDETRILTWSGDQTARLWDAATGKQIGIEKRHEGLVNGAVFNRDETRILTWSGDNTARLWDAETGKKIGTDMRHEFSVDGALFNRNGTRILTWSKDETARLWDAETGKKIGTEMRHESWVHGALFNHDETRILTWSVDQTARLWDAETGKQIGTEMRHERSVNGARFNRDGTRILTWSIDQTARLWDAVTGKKIGTEMRHERSVNGAVFNRNETRILTWSGDNTARLWDAETGKRIGINMRHEEWVYGAVFNRDETRILTWSGDNTARLWDVVTGKQIGTEMRHEGPVNGAVFNRDETQILTWSGDDTARLWDAETDKQIDTEMRHEGVVNGALFNRDGTRILTWSEDRTAKLWDAVTGKKIGIEMRHEASVNGALFNRDGTRILTASGGKTARLWDAETGKRIGAVMRHGGWVNGALFSRDGTRIVTWSGDNTARLWDAETGKKIGAEMRHEAEVIGALFNRDETRILTWSEDRTARLWDAETSKQINTEMRHEASVNGALFNRDGTRILTWSGDETARLWDAETSKQIGTEMRHEGWVYGAMFNRDESRIFTWSHDETVRQWDPETGKKIGTEMRHLASVLRMVFNRDETRILTFLDDGTARLWDAETGKPIDTEMHLQTSVNGALFNRDGTRILTWSGDETARLWDAETGKQISTELLHRASVIGAQFNPDGTRILTWSSDNTARLWIYDGLSKGHLIDIACWLLSEHSTEEISARYGIAIKDAICAPGYPAPVLSELKE